MPEYVRPVDESRFNPERFTAYTMAGRDADSQHLLINIARVPPHGSAPDRHTHPVDKFYYVLRGVMELEIAGERYTVGPNNLVVIPAGVPHSNWNDTEEPELHLVLFAPHPQPGVPNSTPA